jgi:hypothetical protein
MGMIGMTVLKIDAQHRRKVCGVWLRDYAVSSRSLDRA